MKKLIAKLTGVFGAFVLIGTTSHGQTQPQPQPQTQYGGPVYGAPVHYPTYYGDSSSDLGWHFGMDLGPSILQDFNSSKFGFPGHFSARVGERFSVSPEFDFFTSSQITLGANFETGEIYNDINNVQEAGEGTPFHIRYWQVPVLGGLTLKFHPDSFVVPYIGVSGGGDYSFGRIHEDGYYGSVGSDGQINPAVEATAGVRFRLNSVIDFGIGYKYLAAFPSGNAAIANHAVLASLNIKL
jgi:hypothetical protein